jgi:hypothetical protein
MSPGGRPRKGPRIHFQYDTDEQRARIIAAAKAEGIDESAMLRRLIDDGYTVWAWEQAQAGEWRPAT